MTNFEEIKARIGVRLMATIAAELVTGCEKCPIQEFCDSRKFFVCKTAWESWLESETDENES